MHSSELKSSCMQKFLMSLHQSARGQGFSGSKERVFKGIERQVEGEEM